MNSKQKKGIVILVALVSFLFTPQSGQANIQQGPPEPPVVVPHDENGYASFIGGLDASPIALPDVQGSSFRPDQVSQAYLDAYGGYFGVQDAGTELDLMAQDLSAVHNSFRYQQMFQGVPVMAGELIVNTTPEGAMQSMSGEISPDLGLVVKPEIAPKEAEQTALGVVAKAQDVPVDDLEATQPELWIYDEQLLRTSTRPAELVWRMNVSSTSGMPIRELVLVNAHTGGVSLHFNQVDTLWYDLAQQQEEETIADPGHFLRNAPSGADGIPVAYSARAGQIAFPAFDLPPITTYTMNNSDNENLLPGTFRCNLSMPGCTNGVDPHADYAQELSIGFLEFLAVYHGRNSLDDAGMPLVSSVHFGSNYQNAFWNGEQMVYGDGDDYPAASDVVAHEITHGVTDHESNLFYYYQSGAINESFSDVWGEFFDISPYDQVDISNNYLWEIGEDVGSIRDMQDPPSMGDPDKMTSTYYELGDGDLGSNDNGGVHANSGVNNKAVYLMTDGDTFNGYTITGIGMEKVIAIYYEVQTNLLTSGADYKDLYYAVQQACENLTGGAEGITTADCNEVRKALNAVEMHLDPVSNYNPDLETCPSPNNIFYDSFEAGTSNWTILNHSTLGATWIRVTGAGSEGLYSLLGIDYQGYDAGMDGLATYAYTTNNIPIPAGNAYMSFKHIFGFEDPNYDGGLLQYSVNNGSWKDMNSLRVAGMGYNGRLSNLYGNPFGGYSAFVGDSHGYVSSTYDLSAFAGKNLRFKWITSSDVGWYDLGWIIDEVTVFTCNPYHGSAEIIADQPIVAISRPHIGKEIMAYSGINTGADTVYLPMLFKNTWGSYTSTFSVQNLGTGIATFDLTFKDATNGTINCVIENETLAWHGVKTYDITNLPACTSGALPSGWYGSATISSDLDVTAVARVNVDGSDAVTYNGFTGGAGTAYLPMLFRGLWGYQSAFYVQNLHASTPATITISFYDNQGNFTCSLVDANPIGPSVTRGYWMASLTGCTGGTGFSPDGWAGSAVITSSKSDNIVAIGRPHMGTEVAAYSGFTAGATINYLPMLFRGIWGYNAAFYIQNVSGSNSTISVAFYDTEGNYTCTYNDPVQLAPNATRGYWTPTLQCNSGGAFPATGGWAGSAEITSSQNVIAVGRPHLSDGQVAAYNAFSAGGTEVYVPMLFRQYGGNESALYIQNLSGTDEANVTITFYDEEDGLYCAMDQVVQPGASGAVWLAGVGPLVCSP